MPALFLLALGAWVLYWYKMQNEGPSTTPPAPAGPFKDQLYRAFLNADTKELPYWLVYAVASHESGAGSGKAYQATNNAYSIHAGAGTGKTNQYWTGPKYTTSRGEVLRKYVTLADSVSDFCLLVADRPWLAAVYHAAIAGDRAGAFLAMELSGYAGKPAVGYAAALARRVKEIG